MAERLPDNDTLGYLAFGKAAPKICLELNVAACVLVTKGHDGSIGLSGHGVNHHEANELLSVGIHLNLSQHDESVRQGAAGEEAQKRQRRFDGGGR